MRRRPPPRGRAGLRERPLEIVHVDPALAHTRAINRLDARSAALAKLTTRAIKAL